MTLNKNISLLKDVEKRLRRSKIPSAAVEAEQLVRHFSGMDRLDLFTGQRGVSMRARKSVAAALNARVQGKPLSYVLKETEFFGFKFFLSSDTLIPRPETEILVEEALKILYEFYPSNWNQGCHSRESGNRVDPRLRGDNGDRKIANVLDLGTGSGCIAVSLTIHRSNCRMTALDISSKALKMARKNINFYGLGKKARVVKSDLFSAFGIKQRAFWDLIISNPPYVPLEDFGGLSKEVLSEPRVALNGGPQGLSVVHRILDEAPYFMKKHGWLLMEIGDGQADVLAEKIAQEKIFSNYRFVKDLNGINRVLIAQKWIN